LKKRIKRKLRRGEPQNYAYWYFVCKDSKAVKQFIERGSKRQHDCIRVTLQYMKKKRPEKFEEVKGKEILAELNRREKWFVLIVEVKIRNT